MSREVIIKVLDREEIDAHARESFYIDEETHEAKVELLAPYQNMGELIRCIECKYREDYLYRGGTAVFCPIYERFMEIEDYCSQADWREEKG